MLKGIVDSLEGMPDVIKAEYVKQVIDGVETGKFQLNVEGLEDASGLKSALGAVREEKRQLAEAVSALKDAGYTDVKKAVKDLAAFAELSKLDPKTEADKIATTKFEGLKTQLLEEHGKEKSSLSKEIEALTGQVSNLLITDEATKAIMASKGVPELLLPVIKAQTRVRKGDDGRFIAEVLDNTGNPRIGNAQGAMMTIPQLVEELKGHAAFGRAFEASQSGGGKEPGKGGGAQTGNVLKISRSDQAAINLNVEKIANGEAIVVD